jgi:hypothetical protein
LNRVFPEEKGVISCGWGGGEVVDWGLGRREDLWIRYKMPREGMY